MMLRSPEGSTTLPINPSQRKATQIAQKSKTAIGLHQGGQCQCKVASRQDRGKQVRHRDVDIQVDLLHTGMKISVKKKKNKQLFGNIVDGFTGLASW